MRYSCRLQSTCERRDGKRNGNGKSTPRTFIVTYETLQGIEAGVSAAGKSVPGAASTAGLPVAIADLVISGVQGGLAIAQSYRQLKKVKEQSASEVEIMQAIREMKQLELQAKKMKEQAEREKYGHLGKYAKTLAIAGAATAGALALFTN